MRGGCGCAVPEMCIRDRVEAERLVMDTLRFSSNGLCALVQVPWGIFSQTGAQESDLDGVASLDVYKRQLLSLSPAL